MKQPVIQQDWNSTFHIFDAYLFFSRTKKWNCLRLRIKLWVTGMVRILSWRKFLVWKTIKCRSRSVAISFFQSSWKQVLTRKHLYLLFFWLASYELEHKQETKSCILRWETQVLRFEKFWNFFIASILLCTLFTSQWYTFLTRSALLSCRANV